jgi:hypothetical protein
MGTMIRRPTPRGGNRHSQPWKLVGDWGERRLPAMGNAEFYRTLFLELIESNVIPQDSEHPSRRDHKIVSMTLLNCSWKQSDRKWLRDPAKGG